MYMHFHTYPHMYMATEKKENIHNVVDTDRRGLASSVPINCHGIGPVLCYWQLDAHYGHSALHLLLKF